MPYEDLAANSNIEMILAPLPLRNSLKQDILRLGSENKDKKYPPCRLNRIFTAKPCSKPYRARFGEILGAAQNN
jgi:hypothetical protein